MTIDLTVKTLDSNVYQFSVPDEFTVKEFKEYIAQTVSVAWDKQRIIFGGKVLQDDRRLADCNVTGKTVHLVQRVPPPATRGPAAAPLDDSAPRNRNGPQQGPHGEPTRVPLERVGNNVYVGAFTLPRVEVAAGGGPGGGTEQLEHMIQQVISSMVDIGRQATVVPQGASPDGSNINYHINIAGIGGHQEVHSRLLAVRSLLRLAFNGVNVLEGRPPEEYAVQNPPNTAQSERAQRRDPRTSTPEPQADTAASTSSSPSATATTGAQPTVPPEERQQVKTEDTAGDTASSADGQSESQSGSRSSNPSVDGQSQAERDPRRPLSFLLLHELYPTRQTLAHVYDELDYLNERLAPFLNRYRDFLRRETLTPDDVNAEEARRVTHRVAEVTHAISHVQHLLSDLEIDPRHPAHLVVRPSGPLLPGGPMAGHHIDHTVPIRARINVNTVAILSNGNGNLSTDEAPTGARQASEGQSPTSGGMSVGEAAALAAAQAAVEAEAAAQAAVHAEAAAQAAGQAAAAAAAAATAGGQDESAADTQQAAEPSGGQTDGSPYETARPSRSFNPADFVRRVSNAAFRSVSRTCSNASSSPNAAGQTPSREETTASNTTTGTTQTPTTAGVTMGGARGGGGSSGGGGSGSAGTAFTMPTATASHTGLRPTAVVREVFDPFLVCDSIFTSVGRHTERQASWGGRVRFTAPQRSSSVPAATTRRPMPDSDAMPPPPRDTPQPTTAPILEGLLQSLFPGMGVFYSMPLASFINWDVSSDGEQNEFIHDLLATVASTITTSDFMEVILRRNNRSLNGLRGPLREFLNRRLLNGEPYTPELLETRLGVLIDSIARNIPEETREADVYPYIDLVATLSGFLKERTFELFKFILEADEDPAFGDRLFELSRQLVKNTLSLLAMCCRDGPASVERIILARARQFERAENGPHNPHMPLLTAFVTQASSLRENFRANRLLRQYIVMRPAEEGGGGGRRAPAAAGTGDAAARTDNQQMDVDEATQVTADGALTDQARIVNNGVAVDHAQVTLEPPVSHEAALSALRASVPDAPPSAGSEWMGGVPPGWAPIIAGDMGSQGAVQRPLSDAYLAGMPSKRRRLMKPTSPSQLSDIPASIQQAIQRAGVRPRTSVDALNADVQRNTVALQDALQSSIRDALARRLTEETADFDKDKFPHAHRITKPK